MFGQGVLPPDLTSAVLLIDKPKRWSSFDVVRQLRRMLPVRKIGHAGTLDPMATGLLICLVGRATRRMEAFMHLPKTYEGVMQLGAMTPSYDAETPVSRYADWRHLSADDIRRAKQRFVGTIQQQPPMYSAVKVKGERLYKKARRGEFIERRHNTVHVYEFSITGWDGADVAFTVRCSKGTYIRALVHDMGQVLGVGAHLTRLRRTAIGEYHVRDAWAVHVLADALDTQQAS